MKKMVIALGGAAVLGVVGCMLIAWNTGKSMPARMDAMLVHASQQLQAVVGHEGQAKIELLSRDFNTFSTDARYRVTYEVVGEDPVQLEFVDRIEYGPLPWSRLKRMQLTPVMAASSFSLERTEGSATWFAASKGEVPLRGFTQVGYDETVRTQIEFAPFEVTEYDLLFSSDGGSLQLSQGTDQKPNHKLLIKNEQF